MSEFTAPKVYKGQIVIWYAALGGEGAPAVVTEAVGRGIGVSVMSSGFQSMMTPDGVLHVSDPQVRKQLDREDGCWDYTDGDRELRQILQELRVPAASQRKAAAKP